MIIAIEAIRAGQVIILLEKEYSSLQEFLEFVNEFSDTFGGPDVQIGVGESWVELLETEPQYGVPVLRHALPDYRRFLTIVEDIADTARQRAPLPEDRRTRWD